VQTVNLTEAGPAKGPASLVFGGGVGFAKARDCQYTAVNRIEASEAMNQITIRDFDEALAEQLKLRAAKNGQSVEAEAADILRSALAGGAGEPLVAPTNLADAIRAIVDPLGGIELQIPARKPGRQPPNFG